MGYTIIAPYSGRQLYNFGNDHVEHVEGIAVDESGTFGVAVSGQFQPWPERDAEGYDLVYDFNPGGRTTAWLSAIATPGATGIESVAGPSIDGHEAALATWYAAHAGQPSDGFNTADGKSYHRVTPGGGK